MSFPNRLRTMLWRCQTMVWIAALVVLPLPPLIVALRATPQVLALVPFSCGVSTAHPAKPAVDRPRLLAPVPGGVLVALRPRQPAVEVSQNPGLASGFLRRPRNRRRAIDGGQWCHSDWPHGALRPSS